MSPFSLSLWSLIAALIAHTLATCLAIEFNWRKEIAAWTRRSWLVIATASMLLALHHGYTLELALRTGIYDLRQAVLAGLGGILFALGVYGLRRSAN